MDGLELEIDEAHIGTRRVLSHVAITCPRGHHVAVLGPNGAGKTTLLRCALGLVPYSGRIRLDGVDLLPVDARTRARLIAYVPQRTGLVAPASVGEIVMQGRYSHQDGWGRVTRADREAVERALEATDTVALRKRAFSMLSGGEQRRVLLARALATLAPILLLDEPTASLDLQHSLRLLMHLRRLATEGRSVVSVLHHIPDADQWCDDALVLESGSTRYRGPCPVPTDIIHDLYGVVTLPNSAARYRLEDGSSPE